MLTQFRWCISVALCLDAQPIGSTTDPVLPSVARRVPLAESEPKRQLQAAPAHPPAVQGSDSGRAQGETAGEKDDGKE